MVYRNLRKLRQDFYCSRKFLYLFFYRFKIWVCTLKMGTTGQTRFKKNRFLSSHPFQLVTDLEDRVAELVPKCTLEHVTDKVTEPGNCYSLVDGCNLAKNNFLGRKLQT